MLKETCSGRAGSMALTRGDSPTTPGSANPIGNAPNPIPGLCCGALPEEARIEGQGQQAFPCKLRKTCYKLKLK